MRSATVFVVIGALLVLVVVFAALSQRAVNTHPATEAVRSFLVAVKEQDAETVERVLDTETATVVRAGSGLSAVTFKQVMTLEAAFGMRPAVKWSYTELVGMQIDTNVAPTINTEDRLANVTLNSGAKAYLKLKDDGSWRIIYISEPDKERPGR